MKKSTKPKEDMEIIPRPNWYEGRRKNPRVGIAVSNIGAMSSAFVRSMMAIMRDSMFNGIVIDFILDETKPLDDSRNVTVKELMACDPDYIFFADADMTFQPPTIRWLLEQGKDVITAVYCQKQPPHYPVLRMFDKDEGHYQVVRSYPKGKVFTVDSCGAGALLVKASVFKKLKKPYFKWDYEKGISEDIYFCEKVKKAGYEIWVDGGVECGHMADMRPIEPKDFWGAYLRNLSLTDKETIKTFDFKQEEPKLTK